MPKRKSTKKNNTLGKVLLILAGILAILSVLLYYFDEAIGAWWQVSVKDYLVIFDYSEYTNAFGYFENASGEMVSVLGAIGIIVGVLIILGALIMFYSVAKESKGLSLLGWLAVLAGIALFLYGLNNVEDYENILEGLNFITGDDYSIYFGSFDAGVLGQWSWGISIGCFIAIAAVVLGVIGTIEL